MQAKRLSNGISVDYTPSGAVSAGDVVIVGGIVGVAPRDIAANVKGVLDVSGEFQFTKKADAAINFAAGDRVYWDDTNNQATSTATGNTFLGWSTIVAGNTAATVDVLMPYRLYGAPAASANQAAVTPTQDTITDNSTGAASTTIAAFTNLDTLTDSTGGTADNTVADVSTVVTGVDGAGSNAASKADVDTRLTAINNNFKELVDQIISQKAGNTVLVNAVASIAAQLAKIKTDIAANKTLANEIRTLLIALGLWKGAA